MANTNNQRPNGGGRQKRTPEPSPRDRLIYEDLNEGRTVRDIGEEFGLSDVRVREIAKQVEAWRFQQLLSRIFKAKSRQTAKLQNAFRKAMAGWERSKQDAVSVTTRNGKHGIETIVTTKCQCGNPAFLSEAMVALAEIRKIWGAEAAVPAADDRQ